MPISSTALAYKMLFYSLTDKHFSNPTLALTNRGSLEGKESSLITFTTFSSRCNKGRIELEVDVDGPTGRVSPVLCLLVTHS